MMNDVQSVLLGALLISPQYAPDSIPELEIEQFREDLQPTFAAMSGFWNAKGTIDLVEISTRYPTVKQSAFDCMEACRDECVRITSENVQAWTKLVQEQSALGRFQTLAFKTVDALTIYEDLPDIYQQMGEALNLHSEKDDFLGMAEGIDDYICHLDEKPKYIKTGLQKLDDTLHIEPGNFIIIGGRPSAGKTALSLQLAVGMAKNGHKVAYFSLETNPKALVSRIIANQLYAPLSAVKNKTVSVNELDRLAESKKLPLLIRSAATKNVAWMKAQALRVKAQVIFVDYLQIVRESRAGDRYQQITATSIALHELAQTTGMVVVALAQLNRDSAKSGQNPTNADLRESGQIEQDADGIILLSGDKVDERNPAPESYYFAVSKNKEGQIGVLPITFNKQIQRFEEYTW